MLREQPIETRGRPRTGEVSPASRAHVLLVDDEPRFCQAMSETLRQRGHEVATANSLAAAREILKQTQPTLILLDLILPDGNGLELLSDLGSQPPDVVLITGHPAIKSQIENLTGRGISYVTKPIDEHDVLRLVEDNDHGPGSNEDDESLHYGLLVGESAAMRKVYERIAQCGPTDATVLISGESGTGKELVARALHRAGKRKGRFVAANSGGLANELVASELFGHEKGSFTGATRKHIGVFERADGGTLFLDEISEMPAEMQTYLLRTLDSGIITRVGAEDDLEVDVRLLTATNRDTAQAISQNLLREDLFYRLSEFVIKLPPLRERGSDIELLVNHFADLLNERYQSTKRPSREFIDACRQYAWPGNVRELRHAVHRAYLISDKNEEEFSVVESFDSPLSFNGAGHGVAPGRSIREVERELIIKTLEHFEGDKNVAAETLGISLKTLYNRLNEYEVQRDAAAN